MVATSETVGLAEWIIYDTFLGKVYFESPSNEIRLEFFRGNHLDWGFANTTTILSYSLYFEPLPVERLVKKHTFFSGYNIEQSVAGFKIRLARKVVVLIFLS